MKSLCSSESCLIEKNSEKLTALGLLILRLYAGGFMAFAHGWGKLQAYGEQSAQFPDPLGVGSALSMALAIGAEFFCSIAVMLGVMTRAAVLPLIVTMLIAALVIHGEDPFQKKELALMYLFAFITLFCTGAGAYSVDARCKRKCCGKGCDGKGCDC